jgi:hypothetical protein
LVDNKNLNYLPHEYIGLLIAIIMTYYQEKIRYEKLCERYSKNKFMKIPSNTHVKFLKIACADNNAEMVKYILSKRDTYNSTGFFQYYCKEGQMEIAKVILDMESIRKYILPYCDDNFKLCCISGQVETAKMMLSIEGNTIDTSDNELFERVCIHEKIEVAKWLLSIKGNTIDISFNNCYAFNINCNKCHFEIPEWLLSIPNNNIKLENHEEHILNYVGTNTKIIHVLQWFKTIGHQPQISTLDKLFNNYCYWKIWIVINYLINEYTDRYSYKFDCGIIVACINTHQIITDLSLVIDGICPMCYIDDCDCKLNCDHNYCMGCIGKIYKMCGNCPLCLTPIKLIYKN